MRRRLQAGLIAAAAALLVTSLPGTPAAAAQTGGVALDGWGGLHPFGGFSTDTSGHPYWPGWNIARSLVVRGDGTGGWELDGWGGIHQFGSARKISAPAYWPGWDIARSLVITSRDGAGEPDGAAGYVLDGWGGIHAFGGAPRLSGNPYTPGRDQERGLAIHEDAGGNPDGGWVLDAQGNIHAFGAAPALSIPGARGGDAWHALHVAGTSGYAVGRNGNVSPLSSGATAPSWSGYPDWGSWDIEADVAIPDPAGTSSPGLGHAARLGFAAANAGWRGGAVLDDYGGLHPFGGMQLARSGAPYWYGADVARSLVLREDGSGGWELDSAGGIHAFGTAEAIATPAYWGGRDVARSLVMTSFDPLGLPDGHAGYLLDEAGGIHPFGGAPAFASPHYTVGQDTARGLAIHYSPGDVPDGGWLFESNGAVYTFGAARSIGSLTTAGAAFRQFHATGDGVLAVGRWGVTELLGDTGPIDWAGYGDWGVWDVTRDIVAVGASAAPDAQPASAAARAEFHNAAAGNAPDPMLVPACGAPQGTARGGKWIIASTRCEETAAYVNGVLDFATYVTTAGPCCHTPTGSFTIEWKRSPWALASQPGLFYLPYTPIHYAMQFFRGGFLFHDAPWRTDFGPGSNYVKQMFVGSHGCIETPETQMGWLYAFADVGTPVSVF